MSVLVERLLPDKIQKEEIRFSPFSGYGRKLANCVTANGNRVNLNGNANGLNVNNWNDNANSNIGVASARNFLFLKLGTS